MLMGAAKTGGWDRLSIHLTELAIERDGARVRAEGGATADLKGTDPVASPEVDSRPILCLAVC